MEHCGYVVQVKELRKHSNADRLQVATFFGNDTIVSLDTHVGDIGVYFPSDLQLSERFCQVNDLVRRKNPETGKAEGGYMDPEKRNVKAIKLRGEKSDGIYLPITCLADFCTISDLKVGDTIGVVNGEDICHKYIPQSKRGSNWHNGIKQHKPRRTIAPTFYEHVDTAQLAYNLNAFKPGDIVQLTLKCHGTSGRTGYLPLKHVKRTWFDKLLHRPGKEYFEYGYITGTRRVVLDEKHCGGYYESDNFRFAMAEKFEGKLYRGETVYYEIVGFQGPNGAPIMGSVVNSKVKDPEFTKLYGKTTVFSYGCNPQGLFEDHYLNDGGEVECTPCCQIYVYRMTMVNEDGNVVEYSPAQIKQRCEQMNVNVVPEFETFIIPETEEIYDNDEERLIQVFCNPGEYVIRKVEQYFDGLDPIGKTHVREGVVARICNRANFAVYKHKNFSFKVLEGLVKEEAVAPDIEEAQELIEDNELEEN